MCDKFHNAPHKKEFFEFRIKELDVIVFTRSCTTIKLASSADSKGNIFSAQTMK
jgi:hypothetical protein